MRVPNPRSVARSDSARRCGAETAVAGRDQALPVREAAVRGSAAGVSLTVL
jgi:hypothetical protein